MFQRLGIPQVVGFIVMGVLMGSSFLNVVPLELVDELGFVSEIALGLIGFDMGSHLLLGDLASATAPAATVDVLAEYDAQGPLTTSLLAVVGMDDALALLLYSIAAAVAESMLAGSGAPSLVSILELPRSKSAGRFSWV